VVGVAALKDGQVGFGKKRTFEQRLKGSKRVQKYNFSASHVALGTQLWVKLSPFLLQLTFSGSSLGQF
jgi:hypothetical protein